MLSPCRLTVLLSPRSTLPAYQHPVLPAGLHLAASGAGDSAAEAAAEKQASAAAVAAAAAVSPPVPITRSRGTQTDYRESEAQTDPYSPPYRVVDGDWAEELTVAALSWGQLPESCDKRRYKM